MTEPNGPLYATETDSSHDRNEQNLSHVRQGQYTGHKEALTKQAPQLTEMNKLLHMTEPGPYT